MTKDVQSLLRKIVEVLVAEYQPERIILFGPHACGEPNRASDVDLLILKKRNRQVIPQALGGGLRIGGRGCGNNPLLAIGNHPAELEKRRAKGDQFFEEILTRGKVLYAR